MMSGYQARLFAVAENPELLARGRKRQEPRRSAVCEGGLSYGVILRNTPAFKLVSASFFISLFVVQICSATVVIHNETLVPIYVGVYYYEDSGLSELQTPMVSVASGAKVELSEPPISFLKNRYIFADTSQLARTLSYEDFKTITKVRVRLPGHYYISTKDGRLKGYTLTEWHILHPLHARTMEVKSFISQPVLRKIRKESVAVQTSPYKQTAVTVRESTGLSAQELAYRAKRKPHVKRALEKLLGRSLDGKYIPEISLILSGGGYRAMLYGAGSLAGAHNTGLFDALTNIATLSGSTWALSYITFEYLHHNKQVEQSMYDLIQKSTQNLALVSTQEFGLLHDVLLWKSAFDLPVTTIDLYGLLLGNVLFSGYNELRHRLFLSSQQYVLSEGAYPLPIYTAVPAETTEFEKVMYEFTPYEIYAPWGFAVPSYAFGSRFINGSRMNVDGVYPPEQPMSILLGVFGSAYAFTLKRAYEEIEKRMPADLKNFIEKIYVAKSVGQKRVAAALFHNFMMGLQKSPLKNKKNIKMADAGLGITGGLPFQPVSGVDGRRKADMYIIVDISEDIAGAQDLKRIAQYARDKNLKFPVIPENKLLEKQMVTLLMDANDSGSPAVVYLPRTKDEHTWQLYKNESAFESYRADLDGFSIEACFAKQKGQDCTTFNLQYTQDLARKVARLGQFNMQASMVEIKQALNQIIDRKSGS